MMVSGGDGGSGGLAHSRVNIYDVQQESVVHIASRTQQIPNFYSVCGECRRSDNNNSDYDYDNGRKTTARMTQAHNIIIIDGIII